jgi:hypothetical protein
MIFTSTYDRATWTLHRFDSEFMPRGNLHSWWMPQASRTSVYWATFQAPGPLQGHKRWSILSMLHTMSPLELAVSLVVTSRALGLPSSNW